MERGCFGTEFVNVESVVRNLGHTLILCGVLTFLVSVFTELKPTYGRFYSVSTSQWWVGPGLNPHAAWFVQEIPAFFIPVFLALWHPHRLKDPVNAVLLAMFLIHYFQRCFVFPFLITGGKPSSLLTTVLAFLFCALNGFLQGIPLVCTASTAVHRITDYTFQLGVSLWVCGFLINVHSDSILRNLRKPGETGYKIPRGGFFEYVSCANFFGEIVEWWGFAVAAWSYSAFAFAVFTTLFLSSKANMTHRGSSIWMLFDNVRSYIVTFVWTYFHIYGMLWKLFLSVMALMKSPSYSPQDS